MAKAKCTKLDCIKAETCYRIHLIGNPYWQPYFDFSVNCNEENNYEEYIEERGYNYGK